MTDTVNPSPVNADKALAFAAGLGITDGATVNADPTSERSKADNGEVCKLLSIDGRGALTVRLHTPAARRAIRTHLAAGYLPGQSVIKGASPSKAAEKVGVKRVGAIAAAARSVSEALAGLSPEACDIVRALILIEAAGYSAGLTAAKGSMTEHAPFAGELAKVR
jgi:hypothetical protein